MVSACCCANPYGASLPSARFVTRDHPDARRARTVRQVVAPTRRSRVNGHRRRVVVAGTTGYIGRRLVAELVAGGHHVRCLARTPDKLDAEPWQAEVEVVAGDVLDVESLAAAFRETDAAYYLVIRSARSQTGKPVIGPRRENFATRPQPRTSNRSCISAVWATTRAARSRRIWRAVMRSVASSLRVGCP